MKSVFEGLTKGKSMRTGIIATFTALLFAVLSEAAPTRSDAGSTDGTITSLEQIERVAKDTQKQFWRLVPPTTGGSFYLHSEPVVRTVDWGSKAWPRSVLKQMYAEMGTVGVSGSMYPFYRLTVVETRTGEWVYYNSYDQEMWRTPAPFDYNPYLFAFQQFGVETEDELSRQQKIYGRSSNVATEILLLPEVFMGSYVEDTAMEVRAALLAAPVVMPSKGDETVSVGITLVSMETRLLALPKEDGVMMAMASSPPPPPSGGGGTNSVPGSSTSNLLVELTISIPAGFGHMGHIETFAKDNLLLPGWSLADDWIPTYGSETVYWIDPVSSNKMQRFYLVSDGADTDGDGHSDRYEAWVGGTASNAFNSVNVDDDDLHDWLEMKVFGNLSQTGANDFDSDGLLNNEELIVVSVDQPAIMISNPALADSDGDGLNDFQERRVWNTDAMDPDTDNDGREDAAEVLGSPATDPNNSDTVSPTVVFAGN